MLSLCFSKNEKHHIPACIVLILGVNSVTKISFKEQMHFLYSLRPGYVVVIFSYTGIYFDYCLPRNILREGAKVWLVTGSPEIRERFAVRRLPTGRLLTFRSEWDSHIS